MSVTIHEAKTNLSKLLKRVEAGEEIVISRGNKEIAKLAPLADDAKALPRKSRGRGAWKGEAIIHPSFYDDMTPEELSLWEDGPIEPPR